MFQLNHFKIKGQDRTLKKERFTTVAAYE